MVGLVFLSGCKGAVIAPVKGKVTCNGKPVKAASLTFSPVPSSELDREPGKPGTGFSDGDGNYVLSTYKPLDGALVGQHEVTISLDDTNPARCKRRTVVTREVKAGSNEVNIELMGGERGEVPPHRNE